MILSNLTLKWKIALVIGGLFVPFSLVTLVYIAENEKKQEVYTALSGLMNFVDAKQQGVIRFLGQNEKLAKQLAVLVKNAPPDAVQKQFQAIVEIDVFNPDEHPFKKEIEEGRRRIATWEVYHAIDFVRDGEIVISSDAERIGRKMETTPDIRHGYSDVYMEGDIPLLSFGAQSGDGMVYVHVKARMLTVIVNGEIGNLEGDMGAYYLAGVGKTFNYYIVNRDNVMITESRIVSDTFLQRKGSEFPWLMTMGKAVELGIICLPDGTYMTNVGHQTGKREAMGFYTGQNGEKMIGASMPFYDSEWTIVVEQEEEELLGPLYSMIRNVSVGMALLLIIVLGAGFYLATSISRPLSGIIRNMTVLMKGDTDITVHSRKRKDEIGKLANAVEAFRESIVTKKQAEQELKHHRDHLEEQVIERTAEVKEKANRLGQALEREKAYNVLQQKFVSLVSHEFRTPLSIIDVAAQRLVRRKDKADADEVEVRANKVRSAVSRMIDLIDTTLYASRIDAGKIKVNKVSCDLKGLLCDVCERQSELAPTHEIKTMLDDLPPEIFADHRLMDQIFTNLLSNAIKYSPNSPLIEVNGWSDGKNALITITDQGLGIPADDLQYMFGRFFRAKTADGYQGTGIGLSVVKEFVHLHGGSVGVDSLEGEGSTFTVRLPITGTSLEI